MEKIKGAIQAGCKKAGLSKAKAFLLGIFESIRTGAEVPSVLNFLLANLLPVTLGNIIGGAGFVGIGYFLASGKNNHQC